MRRLDLGRPLPARVFAPHKAAAAGLAIGVSTLVVNEAATWAGRRFATQPTVAPSCFGSEEPIVRGRGDVPAGLPDRRAGGASRTDAHLVRMQEAAVTCRPNVCDAKGLAAYRSALFWYVGGRAGRVSRLEREHGEAGGRRARWEYDTPEDRGVEAGLRERVRAGTIRLTDIRQHGEATAILALAGGSALTACSKTDAAQRR